MVFLRRKVPGLSEILRGSPPDAGAIPASRPTA
jgi:hypothetical protein